MKDAEVKAAVADRDAAIARAGAIANEKQALLARIKELEAANGTLSVSLWSLSSDMLLTRGVLGVQNKLRMNVVCLEEQISTKTESQNEVFEDMGELEVRWFPIHRLHALPA